MKYIRTKDGKIFDVSKICIPYQIVENWIDFNSQGRFKIANEADTIEELCDDFVCGAEAYEGKTPFILPHDSCLKERIKFYHEKEKCSISAAIWVFDSNGTPTLKPVAKRNEKGEWELL